MQKLKFNNKTKIVSVLERGGGGGAGRWIPMVETCKGAQDAVRERRKGLIFCLKSPEPGDIYSQ